ncbi:MAG: lipid-A-disaccharide synthase [Verrucomicrobia bacterium]|jgi:lipid-A-disaccharide synthase|nr:lipid-A-disaccharide synthase [Verrucomicrobiota bacterium]
MKPRSFMVIAGEASGDLLAAELVQALRREYAEAKAQPTADLQPLTAGLEPRFFGAGGPRMAAAGVDLAFDMTAHSVIGLSEAVKHYLTFRRLFYKLFRLALERQPDAIICVDFSGFNRRFAHAIKQHVRARRGWFHDWNPRLIQYVSPQVWASREGRAYQLERDCDLLLSIFPFEKDWYAKRVPRLRVEFVGHPMVDRHGAGRGTRGQGQGPGAMPMVLLLPGSRPGELRRHLPVLAEAAKLIAARREVVFRMVLPHESLLQSVRAFEQVIPRLELQVGRLDEALQAAAVALTKSGTITLECAYFGVPAVVFYKTSTLTYVVGKQLVKVKYLAMPNLLADEAVYPEFVQGAATAENLAAATLALLEDPARYAQIKARLAAIVAALGEPGASRRAAKAIVRRLHEASGA